MFLENLLFVGRARSGLPNAEAQVSQVYIEADYDLSGNFVPAVVEQWAVDPRIKDVHSFLLGPSPWAGLEMKTPLKRKRRLGCT